MDKDSELIASVFRLLDLLEKADDLLDVLKLWRPTFSILRSEHFNVIHVMKPELKDFFCGSRKRKRITFGSRVRQADDIRKFARLEFVKGGSAGYS